MYAPVAMRLGLLVVALTLLVSVRALGQEVTFETAPPPVPAEARAHLDRGEQLFEAGGFDAALAEYQAAHRDMEGHPLRYLVEFNVAQCHERLSQYDLALEHYQRYLDEGGSAESDADAVRGRIEVLSGLLGTIDVTLTWPVEVAADARPEVELWLGDRRIGVAPGAIRLPGGNHALEARAAGFESRIEQLQLSSGARVAVTFTMTPLAAGGGLDPAVFWGVSAAAVVAALVGGAIGITVLMDGARASLGEPEDATFTMADVASIRERSLVADVFYGTAGLFAVTAVILYFASDWSGPDPSQSEGTDTSAPSVAVVPWLGPSVVGLSAEGSF